MDVLGTQRARQRIVGFMALCGLLVLCGCASTERRIGAERVGKEFLLGLRDGHPQPSWGKLLLIERKTATECANRALRWREEFGPPSDIRRRSSQFLQGGTLQVEFVFEVTHDNSSSFARLVEEDGGDGNFKVINCMFETTLGPPSKLMQW